MKMGGEAIKPVDSPSQGDPVSDLKQIAQHCS